jgi:hypothetical protein
MNVNHFIRANLVALAFSIVLMLSPDAHAGSKAFDIGYEMGAFFECPYVYKYSNMPDFFKYQTTRDYIRGYNALKAALKGTHPSKVCFDAARASGWFTVR